MISARYAVATSVLLLLALVPTIIHSYAGVVDSDRLTTASIGSRIGPFDGTAPTKRSADWGERRFDSFDWFERSYIAPNDSVVLTAIRSYDVKSLYHHPELAVAYHYANFTDERVAPMPGAADMPVHVLTNANERAIGMYVLHYDGRFISDPIRFQIRTAGELLFSGRKAMTLLFVRDDDAPAGADPLTLPAAQLLRTAVEQFAAGGPAR